MTAGAPAADATGLREALLAGELRVRDATEACLARIEAVDHQVGAFASVEAERALARADELDRALAHGAEPGALCDWFSSLPRRLRRPDRRDRTPPRLPRRSSLLFC